MLNKYELICQYCGFSWLVSYTPQHSVYCSKCKDGNIRAKNLETDKIDYYAGSPPFENEGPHYNS
jgi:hypothetical protein